MSVAVRPDMEFIPGIKGAFLVHPEPHEDARGSLTEICRSDVFPRASIAQVNVTLSKAGVLRGLHYHKQQTDYWYPFHSLVFVALADLDTGAVWTRRIEAAERMGILIPAGIAHGYYSYVPSTMLYMVSREYDGTDEFTIPWDSLGIPWPDSEPTLSERDRG